MQTYESAKGESPATTIPKTLRNYPDVLVCRDLVNGETVSMLCEQVKKEKRFIFSTIRAKEAVEALLRVLLLKVPPAEFAGAITAVVNGRLVRKLCEKCKEPYAPPAEVLRQLGLPPGKVPTLFRPPTKPIDPKKPEVKCDACGGIGYLGRTGFYELLIVNDQMRSILVNQPRLESLREAARKAQHRTLQDEGVLLVARARLAAGAFASDEIVKFCSSPGLSSRRQQGAKSLVQPESVDIMISFLLFLIFFGVLGGLSQAGVWSNLVMLVNVILRR